MAEDPGGRGPAGPQLPQGREAWQQRAVATEQAERARAGNMPGWSAASPPALRTDVFGGSLAGWQALLVTHGTSVLAAGPLLVMDLSGQLASRELTGAAQAAAIPAAQYVLPADLGRCGTNPQEREPPPGHGIHPDPRGTGRARACSSIPAVR